MEWTLPRLRGGFWAKAAVLAVLVVLGDWMFFQRTLWAGHFGLYGLAMIGGGLAVRPALSHDRRARFAMALAATYAAAAVFDFGMLAFLLFWLALGMGTLLPGTGRFDDGWRSFQRMVFHGLASLVGPLVDWMRLSRARRRQAREGQGPRKCLRAVIAVLALPVLGSAVIVWLFAMANPVVEDLLAGLSLPAFDGMTLLRMMLWALLGLLGWGMLRPRLATRLFGTFDGRGDAVMPGVSPVSVLLSLAAFNLLFAMQNAMDIAWLWGLMPLPQDMTLADYAHRGAYPLIATALLAALFVLVVLRPGSQTAQSRAIRTLVIAWLGQNVFLVFSSILRTLDYVGVYGLSMLRLAALLWMGLVALGLVLVGWRMVREKSAGWLINANLIAAGVLLTACCFIDLGGIVARYNIAHARELGGKGVALDLCYLSALDGEALLPLAELERRPGLDPAFRARVSTVRQAVHLRLARDVVDGGWTWRSAQRLRAVADMPLTIGYDRYSCNGNAYAEPAAID